MTFMGKPRDEHVHEHAHETPLMYIPLVVLAVGTVVVSYFLFRDLVLDAVPLGFLVPAIHDEHVLHGAHRPLAWIVGGAFLVGFAVAYLIYRNGLDLAGRFAWRFRAVHQILVHKFFFDEIYGFFLVGGVHVLKYLSYLFDRVVVDGLVNVSAGVTERLARFSGRQLDNGLVDGAVNGVGQGTYGLGGLVRTPQVGRIRNYILFTACGATVVVLLLVTGW
jgi:NADH-quinone oxidoreductase subunit L